MIVDPNIPDPDGFYAAWLAAHEGLTPAASADLNARLVLLLANQCGDQAVLLRCIQAAVETAAITSAGHATPRPPATPSLPTSPDAP